MALKFQAAGTIAAGGVANTGAAHTVGRYEYVDLYYSVAFGDGDKSLVLTVEVSDDGSTWRAVPVRDLGDTGGKYVASKTITADGSSVLRLETQAQHVRLSAVNNSENACTLTAEGFVGR